MGASPVTEADFNPLNWGGDACTQMRALLATNQRMKELLTWLINDTTGEIDADAREAVDGQILPVGTVQHYVGNADPLGGYWLICDGRAVSRTTYAALFTLISTTYGVGDGSTTFNLPNAAASFIAAPGTGFSLGTTGGSATIVLTTGNLPSHTHGLSAFVDQTIHDIYEVQSDGEGQVTVAFNTGAPPTTDATGSATPVPIVPPYICFNAIIKVL